MSETTTQKNRRTSPPAIRVAALALFLCVLLACVIHLPLSFAQARVSNPSVSSLVYLAESENQRLNQRIRTLLTSALGESVILGSFAAGQTSQDSESPVIAIGPGAFTRVREENKRVPVLGLLVDEAYVKVNADGPANRVSAVLSTPPLIRQAAIGKAILPYATRVAMLANPDTEQLYAPAMTELHHLGMEGRVFLVPSEERLIPTLIRALDYGDFVLAAPDSTIYNPRTIKHILLTAYRRNRIVIGPSQAYVKAGSLASSFTPLSAAAEMAADYIRHYRETNAFPEPDYPADFGIEINYQVGRSLNIPLPERDILINAVKQRLDNVEAPEHE